MAKYNYEIKRKVVEAYLKGEGGYKYLSKKYEIPSKTNIQDWVNDYRIADPDALREKTKGRKPKMAKPMNMDTNYKNAEYIKQLENDLLKLRIENAYLKELRRLRLEDEARLKKARIIHSLRGDFKLKDILAFTGFAKATYVLAKTI